jgi:hypothetical protein
VESSGVAREARWDSPTRDRGILELPQSPVNQLPQQVSHRALTPMTLDPSDDPCQPLEEVKRKTIALAKVAKTGGMPVVLTSSMESSNGESEPEACQVPHRAASAVPR